MSENQSSRFLTRVDTNRTVHHEDGNTLFHPFSFQKEALPGVLSNYQIAIFHVFQKGIKSTHFQDLHLT